MTINIKIKKPILFPNKEVFLITGYMTDEMIEWYVPGNLGSDIIDMLGRKENYTESKYQQLKENLPVRLSREILGKDRAVYWKDAVGYSAPEKIKEDYNDHDIITSNSPEKIVNSFNTFKNRTMFNRIKVHKYFTFQHLNRQIVSCCFHNGNGSIGLETVRKFRNKGFGYNCLVAMHKLSLAHGIELKIGTEARNFPMQRVAEKAGFLIRSQNVWITIPSRYYRKAKNWCNNEFTVHKMNRDN